MGSIRKNILTLALSIAVAIAFAEVGLRAWGISYPEFYRLDSRFGWSPRPGLEGIHAMEGRTRIKINAEGFRDVDHETAKPAGVFRVAVLGDSFTEAREVPLEDAYWKVMEALLSRCLGAGAEVLSFAANGYGTAQQLLVLDDRVWKYAPTQSCSPFSRATMSSTTGPPWTAIRTAPILSSGTAPWSWTQATCLHSASRPRRRGGR